MCAKASSAGTAMAKKLLFEKCRHCHGRNGFAKGQFLP
jgi:hypothetical protein